jgi:hypothetical protein
MFSWVACATPPPSAALTEWHGRGRGRKGLDTLHQSMCILPRVPSEESESKTPDHLTAESDCTHESSRSSRAIRKGSAQLDAISRDLMSRRAGTAGRTIHSGGPLLRSMLVSALLLPALLLASCSAMTQKEEEEVCAHTWDGCMHSHATNA